MENEKDGVKYAKKLGKIKSFINREKKTMVGIKNSSFHREEYGERPEVIQQTDKQEAGQPELPTLENKKVKEPKLNTLENKKVGKKVTPNKKNIKKTIQKDIVQYMGKGYKIQAKHIFLTLSDAPLHFKTEEIGNAIVMQEKTLEYLIMCKELHESGKPHFHIYLRFKSKLHINDYRFMEILSKQHNIQKVRSPKNVIAYIKKEGQYWEFLNESNKNKTASANYASDQLEAFIKKCKDSSVGKEAYMQLLVSSKATDIERKSARKMYGAKTFEKDEQEFILQKEFHERGRLVEFKNLEDHKDDPNYELLNFIQNRLRRSPWLPMRTTHLYLWGESAMGKSAIFSNLADRIPYYIYPQDGWHSIYVNAVYQYIFWDEATFKGHKTEDLNKFLGGVTNVELNVKGGRTWKRDNPVIIMTSNKSLAANYNTRLPQFSKECLEFINHEVDSCPEGIKNCKCIPENSIYNAFRKRVWEYNIEYPLHGFINKEEGNTNVHITGQDQIKERFNKHEPINWLDPKNIVMGPSLPSGFYDELAKHHKEGGKKRYFDIKKEYQIEWLKNQNKGYPIIN